MNFFVLNLVNYLWRHQTPMKNDITTIKLTSNFNIYCRYRQFVDNKKTGSSLTLPV